MGGVTHGRAGSEAFDTGWVGGAGRRFVWLMCSAQIAGDVCTVTFLCIVCGEG